MKRSAVMMLAAAAVLAGDLPESGIRPRPSASDYPVQEQAAGMTLGAAVVPPSEVRSLFSTNLKDYIVVEVSVYPGQRVEISPQDFALRLGAGADTIRPANPAAVASAIHRKSAPPPSKGSDITVYPTATIGYESGGYDPVYGGQRRGGWVTGAGVGVGVGGPQGSPPAGSTDRDRSVMQQELQDKSLPSGAFTKPVAGYLFFAMPEAKQKKSGAFELDYYGANGKTRLLFPPVSK